MTTHSASSFHLWWRFPGADPAPLLSEVSAVLEVCVPPVVPVLYYWALQVDFVGLGGVLGGAHAGLQWNPRYPGSAAVNWGGYASAERGGGVLEGSTSSLPGFADDPHTLAYPWSPGREYRFRVFRAVTEPGVESGWRAEVTDQETGITTVVRDLFPERGAPPGHGDAGSGSSVFLSRPVVWSEVFAACDDPGVTVRWSGLEAVDPDGSPLVPEAVVTSYQAASDGGCMNTDSRLDDRGGLLQSTAVPRVTSPGTHLWLDIGAPSV